MSRKVLLSAIVFWIAITGSVRVQAAWNVEADFSIAAGNPNGQWSYGSAANLTIPYVITLYDNGLAVTGELAGLELWRTGAISDPVDTHNTTDSAISPSFGAVWPAHSAAFHPGPDGQYSLYRWTAVANGFYEVSAIFSVGHPNKTTTDVHILVNGSAAEGYEIFAGAIDAQANGNGDTESYSGLVFLQAGDTVDFAVGYGNGSHNSDTTLIDATITQLAGEPVLWLKAGEGVSSDGSGVALWQNQSDPNNHAVRQFGNPQATTATFPNGDFPVIRFNGDDGFYLADAAALRLSTLSIYMVGSIDAGSQSQVFLSNYTDIQGFVLGISDTAAETVKWFTAAPGAPLEPETALKTERPYLITAVQDGGSSAKSLRVNTQEVASGTAALTYTSQTIAGVGVLEPGRQFLTGDIAEILVVDSADAAVREAAENYLMGKYGILPPPQNCGDAGMEYLYFDFNRDCYIDLQDFALFTKEWLYCNDPENTTCVDFWDIAAQQEQEEAADWVKDKFTGTAPAVPFSFVYDGVPSDDFLSGWPLSQSQMSLDANRTQYTLTYTDPATGLEVKCVAVAYNDYPTVEWTVYFKNTAAGNTPILEDILALDDAFTKLNGQDFLLHHFKGAPSTPNDYQPYETVLEPQASKTLSAAGGRSTNKDMSYFNLETGDKGVIVVVGWPGQWSATLSHSAANTMTITAGQELTHLRLYPGEEIRSPLMVVQFWQRDWLRSQNIWRRWMLAHNLPRPGGSLPEPMMSACSSSQYNEMCNANEENQKMFINRYVEEQIPLDFWHMDAGWYITSNCWPGTGTWEVDTSRFPNGLRAISDHAHANGMDIILWFEPERVTSGTWLTNNHPDWVLGGSGGGLLNLGHAEAWNWLVNHVDGLINSEGVDLYRQDFNMDPLGYWRGADAADRQGMTEIKHVVGYLAYWDELRRRHPDMLIDTCASGGRRNDLETLRRSVPLLRSDTIFGPVDQQCHTYGIAFWIPYHGSGQRAEDTYTFRSCMLPYNTACWDVRNYGLDYNFLRQKTAEWRSINHYYLGDYYPLTDYSLSNGDWMAWQFDRPDLGEGMVQAFRRASAAVASMIFKPRGLDADAWYLVKNLDETSSTRIYGKDLLIQGITVHIPSQPGAVVITYQKDN